MNDRNYFESFQLSVSRLSKLKLEFDDFKPVLEFTNLSISEGKDIYELLILLGEIIENILSLEEKVKMANLAISARSLENFSTEIMSSLYYGSFSVIGLCNAISKLLNSAEERSKLDDLSKKLVSLNKVIKNILVNSAWNVISEVECRTFICQNILASSFEQSAYNRYYQIAKRFDLESDSFIDIEKNHILKPVNRVFIKNNSDYGYKFVKPINVSHFPQSSVHRLWGKPSLVSFWQGNIPFYISTFP